MQPDWTDLVAGYVFVSAIVIGMPLIFFIVTFLPGLMRTTGEEIGAKLTPRDVKKQPAQPMPSAQRKRIPAARTKIHERIRNFGNTA